ncbi:hypothetical protein [Georgenia sp. Z1491]|uniref:hypothetical protein n=1 Tax=Georgenia sp. Z1491 TaxID=3416707 RepID=UPI003CE8B621
MTRAAQAPRPTTPRLLMGDVRHCLDPLAGDHENEAVKVRRGAVAVVRRDLRGADRQRELYRARSVAVQQQSRSVRALALESAAAFHGLYLWEFPTTVPVLYPGRASGESADDVEIHRFSVRSDDVESIAGILVTTLERTAIDLARLRDPEHAMVPLDHAFAKLCHADRRERERVDREAELLRARLIGRLREHFAGVRGVRRAIRLIRWASPWSESAWESRLRWIVLTWGVRDAVQQCRIETEHHRWWVDLAIRIGTSDDGRPLWLVVEFDGRTKYGTDPAATSDALVRERRRDRDLERAGHKVLHLTAAEAAEPSVAIRRIRERVPDGTELALVPVVELMSSAPRQVRPAEKVRRAEKARPAQQSRPAEEVRR